jgi:hypothetical protein
MAGEVRHFRGLDLGQPSEWTALAVLERPLVDARAHPAQRRPRYALWHLRRFALGTPYPEIIHEVVKLLRTPALAGCVLVVDQTGVSRAVVELLEDGLRGKATCILYPVTLTSGRGVTAGEGSSVLVPKKEPIGALQVLLQTRRLQIARGLSDAPLLSKELESFRVKVMVAGDESAESWREGHNDDLVLAAALVAWMGEKALPGLDEPPEPPITRYVA